MLQIKHLTQVKIITITYITFSVEQLSVHAVHKQTRTHYICIVCRSERQHFAIKNAEDELYSVRRLPRQTQFVFPTSDDCASIGATDNTAWPLPRGYTHNYKLVSTKLSPLSRMLHTKPVP